MFGRLLLLGCLGLAVLLAYDVEVEPKIKFFHALLSTFAVARVSPAWISRVIPRTPLGKDASGVVSSEGDLDGVPYRLYTPAHGDGDGNLLVWVHGGGFVLGHVWEFQIDHACRRLAHHAGARVLSVEYRKAPEHDFLAGSEDVGRALRAARARWGVRRVAVGGESAGATVALAVALESNLLDHLLLVYPGLEHGLDEGLMASAWILSARIVGWFRSLHRMPASPEGRQRVDSFNRLLLLSPATSGDEPLMKNVSRLPPTHLVSAGRDPLLLGVDKLERLLRAAGVAVERDHYPRSVHGFFCLNVAESDEAIRTAVQGLFSNKK